MSKIDIKVGEAYNLRVMVKSIDEDGWYKVRTSMGAVVFTISPEEAQTLSLPPKYAPCRKFRKGDIVRSKQVNGRWYSGSDKEHAGELLTVKGDEGTEDTDSVVYVEPNDKTCWITDPAYLELITPVEELERYILIHNEFEKYYEVCWKDNDESDGRTGRTRIRATYWYHNPPQTYTKKEAKAAAEAECARLNAEWRKEMEQ